MFSSTDFGRKTYLPDTTQHLRPAGLALQLKESAAECLQWEQRPSTPDHMKKYRVLRYHEPGKIVRHFGVASDPMPEGPFGDKTVSKPGENVPEMIQHYPISEMTQWKRERAEDIYHSSKREPLGKGYVRGHAIPEGLGTEMPFGMPLGAKEKAEAGQAREVIFPTDLEVVDDESGPDHDRHVLSHGAYAPGEQRQRRYDWASTGVDPARFRFGACDKLNLQEGVKKALNPYLDEGLPAAARVVPKTYDDFKAVSEDELGRPRVLGSGDRGLAPDHTYGLPSMLFPEPGVEELIQGTFTPAERAPDADLGKSIREGWRNVPPADNRAFGVPSVRTDLPMPRHKSVANNQNFGNEPDASHLLSPCSTADRGVNEDDYLSLRSKQDIHEIVKGATVQMDDATFEQVFAMAAERDGSPGEACTINTFLQLRNQELKLDAGIL